MATPSWYDVLDVDPGASAAEIRAAWRSGIADLEPGSRRFATLNRAAEVLLDEQSRAAYDAELASQPSDPEPLLEPATAPSTQPADEPGVSLAKTRGRPADQPVQTVPPGPPGPPGSLVPLWLLALLGVLAVAAVAGALWVWQESGRSDRTQDAVTQAQAAAERAIVPVLSYDHADLDADRERAVAHLTGDYREDYDNLFAVISDNAPSTQTTVSAEVVASGIVRSGEGRVDVLLFVDRPTTNKLSPEPIVYKDQVTVTMELVDGEWLIDDMVTSPALQ